MLLDFLVFENTKMSCCNTKIVENQLTQAKLFTMEKKIRALLQKGKCGESLEKEPVWNYIVQSGTYGLFQFHLQTEVNRYENKKAYFLQRIFPNQEQLIVASLVGPCSGKSCSKVPSLRTIAEVVLPFAFV